MTKTTVTGCVQALVLAAAVSALVTPAVALAGSSRSNPGADQQARVVIDRRLPDTLDAAGPAPTQSTDGRSPDTLDATNGVNGSLGKIDRRSPDALDAGQPRPAAAFTPSSGFDWSDAGAAGGAIALLSLLCATGLLWMRRRPRQRMRTT